MKTAYKQFHWNSDIADAAIVSGRARNDGLKCVRIDRQDITVLAHDTNSLTAKNRLNFQKTSAHQNRLPGNLNNLVSVN